MGSQDMRLEQMLGFVKNLVTDKKFANALITLTDAKNYATSARLTIPKSLDSIERKVYMWSTETAMRFATEETQKDRFSSAQMHLHFAIYYANLAGVDIMNLAREVRNDIRKKNSVYRFNLFHLLDLGLG